MCSGAGREAQEISEVVNMLLEWRLEHFVFPIPSLDIREPYNIIQSKFYLTDMPKIQRCDHMIPQIALDGFGQRPYKLFSEPGDRSNIIQNRYGVCLWKRAA